MTQLLTLTSPEFNDGQLVDASYQSDRDNQSPTLSWTHVPADTQSFAIAVHDPDAPTGGAGWWHWMVINLPADLRSLPRNAGAEGGAQLPSGAQHLPNDLGILGYGGFYPPAGAPAHRYIFTLYALDTDHIDLPERATTSRVGFIINSHTIAKADITIYYGR
ncbi:YbhB/YbcL family Raf kinase inhibitor-like protein [Neisseriaceae bacterium ESL0693]|nr:YbhB/YbcL family Raf kinase inhibitor-like protein [Neisseriaceae bacterium ESL0693]